MTLDVLFLERKNEKSTKYLIFKSLLAQGGLSIVKLQRYLRSQFGKHISYQAVRQALLEMLSDNILKKENKEYTINEEWFLRLKESINLIEKTLAKKQNIMIVDKNTTQISLKNLYELGYFVLYSLEQKYFDYSKNPAFMQIDHLWVPFGDQNKRDRLKELLKKMKVEVIVRGNCALDKMLSKWYKRFVKVKLGVKYAKTPDLIVHGDTVIQIYFANELKKKMDRLYSLKGLTSFNVFTELSDMTYKDYGIEIIITKNKVIAQQTRDNIAILNN